MIGGPGSFMIVADNFDDFGRAVRTKLVREISGVDATLGQHLPEPLERRGIARELHRHAEMAEADSERCWPPAASIAARPPGRRRRAPSGRSRPGPTRCATARSAGASAGSTARERSRQRLARPAGLGQRPIEAERRRKRTAERHVLDAAGMADQHARRRAAPRPATDGNGSRPAAPRTRSWRCQPPPPCRRTGGGPGDEQRRFDGLARDQIERARSAPAAKNGSPP